MLSKTITFIFITSLFTTVTAYKQPISCIHGQRTGRNPDNPKCGPNSSCKPDPKAQLINGSVIGVPGFCEDLPPNCTPDGSGCGVNGICNKRGYCELAVTDTSQCDEQQPWVCKPGGKGCQDERFDVFSMCNRCGVCVPVPQSLRVEDRMGIRQEWQAPQPHKIRKDESMRVPSSKTALVVQAGRKKQKRKPDQPNPACGLMGMEARAGLPARPILAQCGRGATCTPADPNCTSNCKGSCVPKPECDSDTPCPSGFFCGSREARNLPLRDGEDSGQCERIREPPLPANVTVPAGRRCGMNLPNCPQPQQYCVSNEPSCFSQDVCPGTCQVRPAKPPQKYPSCGGMTRTPGICPSPNLCINDPYNGPSCGMSCDVPGICVRPIPCGGPLNNPCRPDSKCVRDPRTAPCNPITMVGCGSDMVGLCV